MNTYEFWNDMDKIFDAIVAYQEKTIEFNKRFISPWVNLGKVFDKQPGNETLIAHKNAIEIDPKNARSWFEFGRALMQAGNFDESIQAYHKALELGFESGELYKNIALAQTLVGKYQEAIPFIEKGIELSEKEEEQAALWNQMGNVYRKLNDYAMALHAFQQADQFDVRQSPSLEDHAVLTDSDEVADVVPEKKAVQEDNFETSQPTPEVALDIDSDPALEEMAVQVEVESVLDGLQPEEGMSEEIPMAEEPESEESSEIDPDMPVILNLDFSSENSKSQAEIDVPELMNEEATTNATGSEFLAILEENSKEMPFSESVGQEVEEILTSAIEVDPPRDSSTLNDVSYEKAFKVTVTDEELSPELQPEEIDLPAFMREEKIDYVENLDPEVAIGLEGEDFEASQATIPVSFEGEDFSNDTGGEEDDLGESSQEYNTAPLLSAYEEYLKDYSTPIDARLTEKHLEDTETVSLAPTNGAVSEAVGDMDSNVNLTADTDTKNAHVWNELGNVYFNAGSYDDAISAYIKAIEFDKHFAWAYTNLATSYVEKERYDDAILLYERGIELFSDEKDKAVTWNKLGNVYRRLNDYENAIDAYQRADDLDPTNATITQQSRFSLLGNEKVGQEVKYTL